jgi:hypothetical protein
MKSARGRTPRTALRLLGSSLRPPLHPGPRTVAGRARRRGVMAPLIPAPAPAPSHEPRLVASPYENDSATRNGEAAPKTFNIETLNVKPFRTEGGFSRKGLPLPHTESCSRMQVWM